MLCIIPRLSKVNSMIRREFYCMTFLNKASVRILNSLKYFRFYNEMGGGNSKTTVNYLISLIDRVHKIYEDTIWRDSTNGQGFSGNLLLQIYSHKEKFGKNGAHLQAQFLKLWGVLMAMMLTRDQTMPWARTFWKKVRLPKHIQRFQFQI